MALSGSAVSELFDAFGAGDGVDLIRDAVTMLLQELIEVETAEQIGAGRAERTDTRVTDRNGSGASVDDAGRRHRAAHPQAAQWQVLPEHLEPRRRIDQALDAVVTEAYVNGVSTRAVDSLVEALGATSGIKRSEVSRICAGLVKRRAHARRLTPSITSKDHHPVGHSQRHRSEAVASIRNHASW